MMQMLIPNTFTDDDLLMIYDDLLQASRERRDDSINKHTLTSTRET